MHGSSAIQQHLVSPQSMLNFHSYSNDMFYLQAMILILQNWSPHGQNTVLLILWLFILRCAPETLNTNFACAVLFLRYVGIKTTLSLQKKELLITVRGTAQVEDVITDLTALPTVRLYTFLPGICHAALLGFEGITQLTGVSMALWRH